MLRKYIQVVAQVATALTMCAALSFGQQAVYGGNTYHGSFVNGNSYDALQYLGPFFEMPQVTAGATGFAQWTKGAVYPDGHTVPVISTVLAQGNATQFVTIAGIQVAASGASGIALDASKSSCTFPALSSCDIAFVPYQSVVGTITGTFTVGELVTQSTSSATAYALNAATVGGTLYLSKTISGTPDATHTWTGGSSSATLATPAAVPSNAGGEPVLVTTSLATASLPGVSKVAFMETSSASVPTVITYPYQIDATVLAGSSLPALQSAAGALGPAEHSVLVTGAVGTAITFSATAVFTSATSYSCAVSDTTASHAAWSLNASGTSTTPGGTGTDAVVLYCVGY